MTWLGLTVVAAIVTTIGTLLGLLLKEVFLARWFERWKASRGLEEIARKYHEPIGLAALELCNRLSDICEDYPPDYLDSRLLTLKVQTASPSSIADTHYKQY